MAIYTWKGKNRYGDLVGGERIGASVDEVTRSLQKEQITIISVGRKRWRRSIPFLKREKVRLKELAVYSRQLSVLIDAELPLIQSLGILAEQQKNKYFKKVINTIKDDVEAGSTLHQAKRKHPKVFDDLYCNLVGSGEQSGSLDVMLRRLAEYIEKTVKLRAQVKQAMIYPVAIVIFAIVVAIFLLWKVIPVFASIFIELGRGAARADGLHRRMSNFVQKYIIFIFLGDHRCHPPVPVLPEDPAGPLDRGPHPPQAAALREAPEQGRHLPRDPDPGHAHLGRRPDAREPEDHVLDRRERPHRESRSWSPAARVRGEDPARVPPGGRALSR